MSEYVVLLKFPNVKIRLYQAIFGKINDFYKISKNKSNAVITFLGIFVNILRSAAIFYYMI
jgi:hypothetical protein